MDKPARVCELCTEAATEEALAAPDEVELLCRELGADIADHLCEEIELAGETACLCACHPGEKQKLRQKFAAEAGS